MLVLCKSLNHRCSQKKKYKAHVLIGKLEEDLVWEEVLDQRSRNNLLWIIDYIYMKSKQ